MGEIAEQKRALTLIRDTNVGNVCASGYYRGRFLWGLNAAPAQKWLLATLHIALEKKYHAAMC